jgi:hypothetical protein
VPLSYLNLDILDMVVARIGVGRIVFGIPCGY